MAAILDLTAIKHSGDQPVELEIVFSSGMVLLL